MLTIKLGVDTDTITKFFKADPKLCYIGLSDNDLTHLYYEGVYKPIANANFLGIYCEDVLVALFKWEYYTEICISFHLYIHSVYHHTGLAREMKNLLVKYFSENTNVKKAIVTCPRSCDHVIQTCEGFGMTHEGTITNSIIWRKEIEDLLIYGLPLGEVNKQ